MKPSNYWEHRAFLAERALTETLRVMGSALPHAARAFEAVSREWANNVAELDKVEGSAEEHAQSDHGLSNALNQAIVAIRAAQRGSSTYREIAKIIAEKLTDIRIGYVDFLPPPDLAVERKNGIYGITENGGTINVLIIQLGVVWLKIDIYFSKETPIGNIALAINDAEFVDWDPVKTPLPVHLLADAIDAYLLARGEVSAISEEVKGAQPFIIQTDAGTEDEQPQENS